MTRIARWCGWRGILLGLGLGGLLKAADGSVAPAWPDAPPVQLREEVFGLRLRVIRETKGIAAGEKFLRAEFAKDPASPARAFMAWAHFFGGAWEMPSLVNPLRGEVLAQEAAAAGSAVATDVYGRALGQGLVPGQATTAAQAWLERAAQMGVPWALGRLGYYQTIGFGSKVDVAGGIALARRAAELGVSEGLILIAKAYEGGRIIGEQPQQQALLLYFEAARHADGTAWRRLTELGAKDPRAQLLLQVVRVNGANDAAWMMPNKARGAVKDLEAIAGNEALALVEIGEAALVGYYAKQDYARARSCFESAAAQGNEDAKFFLAKMKLRGFGQPKQPTEGVAEIRRQAEAGNVRAAAYLGWAHYWGVAEAPGVKKDARETFRWVRQAAERGDLWSLVNLAVCYEHGIGTPENYALAAKVYWQAYVRGYQPGLEKTRRLLNFVKD